MALNPGIIAIAVGILSVLFFLWRKADASLDPDEPPIALSRIPFIGHILGLVRYQIGYFENLSRTTHPIFTLKIFNSRIYVVKSPEYVALTLREWKTLTFDPFTTAFVKNALGAPPDVIEVFEKTMYLTEIHTKMHGALSIGPDLAKSNVRVLNVLTRYLVPQETNLYALLREAYTIAMGEAFYGPDNPVPGLIDEIWDFEDDLGLMMIGFFQPIVARKAWGGQKRVSKAFKAYYDAGLDKNANELIQGRARIARAYNLDNTALGIFEMAICFAPITNVVPTVFWMLTYIYADADLLRALRHELAFLGNPLETDKLRSCPLLISTFQEIQRLKQHGNAVRWVSADTRLDGYLLKKGAVMQIPSSVLNTAPSVWGPDAGSFNARRFLDLDDKKTRQRGYIPFGGGRNLCPGRHLAFTEALGFVAAFVLGFDMQGAKIIGARTHKLGFGARKPERDLKVSIRRREGFKDAKWTFNVGGERDAAPE